METDRKGFSLRDLGLAILVLPVVWPEWAAMIAIAIIFELLYLF